MKVASNVTVLLPLIGMEQIVFFVLMARSGTKVHKHVAVVQELNGMVTFVLSFKVVMEECFGIKILGHVNVQLRLFGMGDFVWPILVLEDRSGMLQEEDVFVLLNYSS